MTDLETLLRTTLAARADEVTSGPEWAGAPARSRHRWFAPLAAAAAVLLVVGLVVGVSALRDGGDRVAPGTACVATLPAAWRAAVHPLAHDNVSAAPVAVAPDGTVYLADNGAVTAVDAAGTRTRVFDTPDPDNEAIDGVFADAKQVLVTLTWLPLGRYHFHPNPALTEPVTLDVYLIDRRSGEARRVTGMTEADLTAGSDVVDDAVLYGGEVVWDVRPDAGSNRGRLVSYDPVTGDTAVIVRGRVGPPRLDGGAITWPGGGYSSDRAPRMPHINPGTDPLFTDGTGWAWAEGAVVHWATLRDQRSIRLARLTKPTLLGVAGPLVFLWDETHDRGERLWLLDTRSRALAPLGISYGGDLFSAAGYVATVAAGGGPVRIDTTKLPALHC